MSEAAPLNTDPTPDANQSVDSAPETGEKPKPKKLSGYQRRRAAKLKREQEYQATCVDARAVLVQPRVPMPETAEDVEGLMRLALYQSFNGQLPVEIGAKLAYIATQTFKASESKRQMQQMERALEFLSQQPLQTTQDLASAEIGSLPGTGEVSP